MENKNKPFQAIYGANELPFKDDGAFEQINYLSGLTKREYAAIHCIEMPPAYFIPTMRNRPKEVSNLYYAFGAVSNHPHKELFKYFIDGKWLTNEDLDPEATTDRVPEIPESLKIQVKNHIVKLRKWKKRDDAWKLEFDLQRIKQWRYLVADCLL
jgi:hypothetical protein